LVNGARKYARRLLAVTFRAALTFSLAMDVHVGGAMAIAALVTVAAGTAGAVVAAARYRSESRG